ncbi:WD40 repeat domain-containing protein [Streptomyces sp. NBC_01353]|uniref:WD40 repeat domain-containing protein n=1 Tax=Streptomyces sp. NBC_01353 TaxID=2903835 RepID=UPI002E30F143|nr:WD40 repeat domain-containing protein [Streptomyces sp. NBC_01353]
MTGSARGERPAAGTEAQATALLGWLTDPDAPRLCLVTGDAHRGKSALLSWLAAHGARTGARRRRSTRELIPLAGQSALGTAWTIANRLGVVARTPGELVQVLATTEARRAVLVLTDLHRAAEPEAVAELIGELSELGRIRLVVEVRTSTPAHTVLAARRATVVDVPEPAGTDGAAERQRAGRAAERFVGAAVDLADPVAVCEADPLLVTAGYTSGSGDDHGGLRSAWLRAGQSLCRDQEPADRALVLLGALGDGADPRLRPALRDLAADAPWRVRWTRVWGDLAPRWPGPVTALGTIGDRLLVAGPTDAVHLLRTADATPAGQTFASPARRIKTLAPAPDGTLLLLDERGRLHTVRGLPGPRPPYLERLTAAVAATLTRHPGTALAAISGSVVVGDRLGSVHAFGLTGIHQAALHSGRVTAVTAVEAPPTPFLCSGGLDGTVRLWTPGQDPHPEPLAERPCPVVALHAAPTPEGPSLAIAWADGLIELHHLDTKERLSFRPGPPVRAVVVTPDGGVVAGMDEALLRLDEGPRLSLRQET